MIFIKKKLSGNKNSLGKKIIRLVGSFLLFSIVAAKKPQ